MDPVVVGLKEKLVGLIDDEVLEVLNVKIRVVFDVFNEFAGSGDDDVDLLATLNDVVFVVFRV